MFMVQKAIDVSVKIIDLCGEDNRINYTKLIKLIYLSEREMIMKYRHSMTGDAMYAMPLGPVPSKIYNLIRDYIHTKEYKNLEKFDQYQAQWNKVLETIDYDVKIKENAVHKSTLKDHEIAVIELMVDGFGALNWKQLVEFTHRYLPEWENPHGSSTYIPEEVIASLPA